MSRHSYPDPHCPGTVQRSPQASLPCQIACAQLADPCSASITQIRRQALQAVDRHDYRRAIAILNRLIVCHPDSAADYSNRGLVYLWSGQPQRALQDFNRAIKLNPGLASSYNNRANYFVAQRHLERALEDYDQAIDLDPFHVKARINRAITLRDLQCYSDALDGLEEALVFNQWLGEIYAERGRTYHLMGEWNGAIADYRRALPRLTTHAGPQPLAKSQQKRQQVKTWLAQLQAQC